MKTEQQEKLANEIKDWLIQLAIKDKLPLDMTTLNVAPLQKLIKKAVKEAEPTTLEKAISDAHFYLCEGELSIADQLKAIAKHENDADLIDNVEGVVVWEKLEGTLAVDDFLRIINYPYPDVF